MKKYLITIEEENSLRLQNFFSQSSFHKIRDEFSFFGIIGNHLTVKEYFFRAVTNRLCPLTPGELGCALSHLSAIKDFLASDDEYAVIFEDDVTEVLPVDLNQLEHYIHELNLEQGFLLSLGGIQMEMCYRVRGKLLAQQLYGKNILKIDKDFLQHLFYAYAYVIDRKMARLLIEYHGEQPKTYDHWHPILEKDPSVHFYGTFIFDHPKMGDDIVTKSYLEQERLQVYKAKRPRQKFLHYMRRKIKRHMLDKFS
ncbi:glycosyltransferase family 25 protein [Acinetobacter sp. B5B]|uniref:glycosyltransferase family 25 protein n=1 Tax=Acinetobacter baretiae TaxID=2605383 RepID=UPI0018C1D5FD|nr:glycosyltransferase family 25 protein [Acinetobacter baretiae]MBF7682338.1 glycosyltransferase family 25 protein [Acinetobacter baretiae]MBF7685166.1 glycosyltransferase family 25 protein [Acinetobacter baretiae]